MVLSLKLADVPSHPFAKEAFETTLWLMDGSELVCGRSVPVSLSLHFEDRTAAPATSVERFVRQLSTELMLFSYRCFACHPC